MIWDLAHIITQWIVDTWSYLHIDTMISELDIKYTPNIAFEWINYTNISTSLFNSTINWVTERILFSYVAIDVYWMTLCWDSFSVPWFDHNVWNGDLRRNGNGLVNCTLYKVPICSSLASYCAFVCYVRVQSLKRIIRKLDSRLVHFYSYRLHLHSMC